MEYYNMLLPLAMILILSKILAKLCSKFNLPTVVGLLVTGLLMSLIRYIPGQTILDVTALDGLGFLAGKSVNTVNQKAFLGTVLAHTDGGVPNIVLELDSRSAYDFGYLVYFFEKACAVSGYLLGVNPFNQPGVEAYKKNMFALLGKPGYEERKAELEKRISELG